jgi:hypothetical protein
MSLHKQVRLALGLLVIVSVAAAAYALGADDAKKKDDAGEAKGEAKQAAAAQASDPAKEMEAWMALSKPGKEHAALKRMAGEYDVEVEMIMQPGAPPQKSKGKEKSALIMDGRYLHGDYTGEMMGKEFHGASLMGYDNFKKKYFSAWIDDMSTGIMVGEGTASPDGKVITMTGVYDDPMTKQKRKYRWVTTLVSDDKHTFDWYDSDPEGKGEYRMMRNTYTRVK